MKLKLTLLLALLLGLLAMSVAWRQGWLAPVPELKQLSQGLRAQGTQLGLPLSTLAFAVALSVALPLSLLSIVTIAALGPWYGLLCCFGGALLSAAASHRLGQRLGHEALLQWGGPRIRDISKQLGRHGLWAVIATRLVPIAPFAVVNTVAGATHIRLRHMLLGTLLGMAPSTLAMALFIEPMLEWLGGKL